MLIISACVLGDNVTGCISYWLLLRIYNLNKKAGDKYVICSYQNPMKRLKQAISLVGPTEDVKSYKMCQTVHL